MVKKVCERAYHTGTSVEMFFHVIRLFHGSVEGRMGQLLSRAAEKKQETSETKEGRLSKGREGSTGLCGADVSLQGHTRRAVTHLTSSLPRAS